jgi:hypothetical protein
MGNGTILAGATCHGRLGRIGLTLVPVPVTGPANAAGTAPRPTDAHFTPSEKAVGEHFVVVGDGKGSHFMHLLRKALHLTLQARYLHCLGCHFEVKQIGFTGAYQARQCLLTPRNTFISILGAGLARYLASP